MRFWSRVVLVMLGLVFLGGCRSLGSLPFLRSPSSARTLESVQVGVTSKREVLHKVGRPNVMDSEKLFVYEWSVDRGSLIPRWKSAVEDGEAGDTVRAIIEFDARDRVRHFEIQRLPLGIPRTDSKQGGWAEFSEEAVPGQCCLVVAVSPDGSRLAAGGFQDSVFLWSGKEIKPEKRFQGQSSKAKVTGLSFSPDGSRLATAAKGRGVVIWDPASARPLLTLQGEGRRGNQAALKTVAVTYSPDGRYIATGDAAGKVMVWEAEGRPVLAWELGKAGVTSLAWSKDGLWLAAGTDDGRVALFDFEGKREIAGMEPGRKDPVGRTVAFSPNGSMLAANDGRIVEIWDFQAIKKEIQTGPVADLNRLLAPRILVLPVLWGSKTAGRSALAFSPDGNLLAAVSPRGVSLWRTGDGTMEAEFPQPGTTVFDVIFDPSGKSLKIGVSGGLRIGNL